MGRRKCILCGVSSEKTEASLPEQDHRNEEKELVSDMLKLVKINSAPPGIKHFRIGKTSTTNRPRLIVNCESKEELLLDLRNKLASELAKNEDMHDLTAKLKVKIEVLNKDKTIEHLKGIIEKVKGNTVVSNKNTQTDAALTKQTATQTHSSKESRHVQISKSFSNNIKRNEPRKPKLLILADEHGRNLVHIFRNILPLSQITVEAMLRSSAQMHDITKDALNLSSDFTKLDYTYTHTGRIQCCPYQRLHIQYKKRKKWSEEDMAAAVQAVREKKMGYLKAAKTYNVPRTTVFRLANQTELSMPELLSKKDWSQTTL
ncbi:unnamed protein product [Acanthoscelides obtectus]|uniref:HTH psq-type domain-containing protein n=1 Tax=Acanthoscelides obtectus TaxID=200917 RepID=A0A9P0L6P1_ACAOB|nr:unnamed protein product [Acanthoscelides obtectus]CAK1643225.1 hypothetical protein AOBTE_LOCUS13454 [Acanthoscelides obtectus]